MRQSDIQDTLHNILRGLDITDILDNKRTQEEDRTESLLSNLKIVIKYMTFDIKCLRKELFDLTGEPHQK